MIDGANGLETKKRLKQKVPTVTLKGTAFAADCIYLFGMILRVNSDCFTEQRFLFM
jgi:hypothetical protein